MGGVTAALAFLDAPSVGKGHQTDEMSQQQASLKALDRCPLGRCASKKTAPYGAAEMSVGADLLASRGDRIRTCGILLPKRELSLVVKWISLVREQVFAVFLGCLLSPDVTRCLTAFAHLSHNVRSEMPRSICRA